MGKQKKGLAILLTIAMVIGMMPGVGASQAFADTYTAPPTYNGVYQISTAEHLYWFAQHVNAGNTSANAVLTGDIDVDINMEEWTPIGTNDNNKYTGTFDGQGHTIRGLRVTGNADNVGLFGRISEAHIRNVGVAESSFQGNKYVGGICGYVRDSDGYSTIENCFSTAFVSGNSFVGGLCGYVYGCRIFNSYSAGTVTGDGPLVKKFCGVCDQSTVGNCYYLSESNDWGIGIDKKQIYFQNGDVAYRLSQGYQDGDSFRSGDIWGQNIGTDGLPVFYGKKVFYAPGNCHNHEQEYCSLCQGGPTQTDGVYQLYTAEHLYWFAGLVNGTISGLSQDTTANAVLCADITINQDVTDTSGLQAWTPVGTQEKPYTGTFDGQGHTISGLYVEGAAYGGLFGNTGGGAEISNVGVINSKISATEAAGGICGANGGTIHDCYSTGSISSSGIAGGLCGTNSGTVKDCYSTGSISGSAASGGIYGQTNGEGISNCYYLAATETDPSDGTAGKTQEQFGSGEVCYLLNGSLSEGDLTWGQAIGSNTAPLFGEKAVFYARSQYHNHAGGDCSLCAGYSPEQIDGVYQLYTADDLYWFAGLVNGTLSHITQNSEAKAVLKADIAVNEKVMENGSLVDTKGLREWTPIGVSGNNSFKGTFDGQGHTISGLYLDKASDCVGLFGYTYIASVSNVTVADSYLSGNDNVGGVIGVAAGGTITDCHNTESVFVSGTENVGGVIGLTGLNITVKKCDNVGNVSGTETSYNVGGVIGNAASGTVTDCHNEGRASGHGYVGGITGTVLDGAVVKNSYNRGSISGDIDIWVGAVAGAVSGGTVQNCYYLSDSETDSIDGTACKTAAQFRSGEVAWLLNDNRTPIVWGQNIGEDVYPLLNGQPVYATYPCLSFSNKAFASENKKHTYDEGGTCTECGVATKPAVIDGVYQISNEAQLYWFAGLVNGTLTDGSGSNASANAVLTSDITVNRGVLNKDGSLAATSGLKEWTPIGVSGNNSFKGTFDGQGHTISGLYLDKASDYVGLFGCTYIASISNVRVTDSYLAGKDYVGGVIGHAFAGSVTNCHNTGRVSGENCVGGVIGQTIAYEEDEEIGRITVTNCHNTGRVSGKNCVGGVIGNAFVDTTVSNCYNTGNVSGTYDVGGVAGDTADGVTVTNCYYLADSETDSISGTSYKNEAQFAGGEVCYLLNGSRSAGTEQNPLVWYQSLGENGDASPVLDNTHGIVYRCTGCPGIIYSNTENESAQHSFKPVPDGTAHKCERCGVEEAHSTTNLAYSANEDTDKITVSCGECGEGLGYVQLNAPSGDLSYDNSEKEATVTDAVTGIDFSSAAITYSTADGSAPKAAGTYTASITLGDGEGAQTVSVTYTIEKAASGVSTAPSAKPDLTYSGSAQELVTAGSGVTGGTLLYSTTSNGAYLDTIPKGTDAGGYSVWYKVAGDANHTDTQPAVIEAVITRFDITGRELTIRLDNTLTYTGAEQTQTVSEVSCNQLSVTYTVSDNKGTAAGDYELTVTGTGNFTGTAKQAFSIGKKSVTGINQTLLVKPKTSSGQTIDYDLSKLIPDGVTGTTGYAVSTVTNGDGVLSKAPGNDDIKDGILTLNVAGGVAKDLTATVKITFTNANYEISEAALTIKTIDKTSVTLSGVTCGSRAYNGKAYAYTGIPVWKTADDTGQTVKGETTVTYYAAGESSPLVGAPANAGSYRAEFAVISDEYTGTASYSFDITKAVATVAAKNKNIYVGDAVPDLNSPKDGKDYTVTGLYGEDKPDGTVSMSYGQQPDNTKTGTYDILIGGLTAPAGDNYTLTFTKGTLSIKAKSSGGGGGGGGLPATPNDQVTQSGDSTTADLSGSTVSKGGETTTTVDQTTADKLVDKAVSNNSEEVIIHAEMKNSSAASSTKSAEVTLPAETLGAIAEKTDADVVIKTDVAEVKLDNKAAEAIAQQAKAAAETAGRDETVSISAEKVKEGAKEVRFVLKVATSGGKVISGFNGGSVSVTVNVPMSLSSKKIVCVYIDGQGHYHKVEGKLNPDGTFTFTTSHFSTYSVMAQEDADKAIEDQKEAIKAIKFKLSSRLVKTKSGKKAVKLIWTNPSDIEFEGVAVYRSTKKNSGYGKKPFFISNSGKYTNTAVKSGKKYYYKVRAFVTIDGERVYTDYSNKAWRTVK